MARQTERLTISVDEGTAVLAAEILRQERNTQTLDLDSAWRAITNALRHLTDQTKEQSNVPPDRHA
ncbi:hypothetical protein JI664_22265 [Rhodobacter sp. NTK016B]|uniref:hypothetical protein n=1 Tax=Rhodobacter sp. NTK016B TaxID=2759676 RepID=UPI001A8FBA02|nr:hypothetical protein [Rhodobacter sp. NTK016B]MBN8294712.1 hypothetical protein [Rhodobacter sp. NTK016B]